MRLSHRPARVYRAPAVVAGETLDPDGYALANDGLTPSPADGSGIETLNTTGFHDTQPAWSPDGAKISFARVRPEDWDHWDPYRDVFVMDRDGSGVEEVTRGPIEGSDPAWSPDGRWIILTRLDPEGSEIAMVNADGSDPVDLTHQPGNQASPSWLPSSPN